MDAADTPNQANLARLTKLVGLAEELGLYLDITGLGSFTLAGHPTVVQRAAAGRSFDGAGPIWEAIATACAGRASLFAYNLMNEPVVSGDRRTDEESGCIPRNWKGTTTSNS